ncbi:MAG TPA: Gfo/Idh/MocA family oxidoreductase [Polyangiaceae bacterium]|nr:Gfo/Idh/MocA family oxidoreductase [Polyangiaceae bacterium]
MPTITRRSFLAASTLASASFSARSWAQVSGANGDLRIAVVGLNGKGKDHVEGYRRLRGVRVVALCDVDAAVLDNVARSTEALAGPVQRFADYRELLARRDIDAVSIVTPNHQHALQAIWALQAGKDVFVEKPVSHDLWEGQQLVRAAEKYGRIVQSGMQNRSSPAIAEAIAWQRAGHIGKVTAARGFCYKRRESIGKTKGPQPVPASVNYDLWLGPAPHAPLRRTRLHYDWHWQWATGNGDIGNQGNHQLDVARRFLGEAALPPRVCSVGGRLGYSDDGETANTLLVSYDYASAPLIFELRGLPAALEVPPPGASAAPAATVGAGVPSSSVMDQYRGLSVGNIIDCEGGYISVPAKDYSSAQAFDREGRLLEEWKGTASHYANFIQAVRSRRVSDLNAPIGEGHVSSSLSHLANISLRIGHAARPSEVQGQLAAQPLMAEAFSRLQGHLRRNEVDLERTPLTLGAALRLDPTTQVFLGEHAPAAQRFARHPYRKPFVLPAIG